MTVESYTPDELTPEQELDNILTFAGVIVSLPSSGSTSVSYAESIIKAAKRVKDSISNEEE